jgi:prolyl-tRNA synthetase
LEEELIVRPTSETIIWNTYRDWIQSYRDLPILINQWANVVRWEMRTKLFLRTAEFHWQEGHTAHATAAEAVAEAQQMLNEYANFMENYMAIPVIKGVKSVNERFAGAEDTYTCEGLMQDGRALQMGTSHFLGQNFARAFDVQFLTASGERDYVWATSWGVSTRLMGALVMVHSDDDGLVIPPKIAPLHVVMVPLINKDTQARLPEMQALANRIKAELGENYIVKYDDDDTKRSGFKFAEYELRGVPIRIAFGGRDLDNGTLEIARRDTREKMVVPVEGIGQYLRDLLDDIQQNLFNKAMAYRQANSCQANSWDEFKIAIGKGGFVMAHWDGTTQTEEAIKAETKATIRCIPLNNPLEDGVCVYSGKPSTQRVIFARAH